MDFKTGPNACYVFAVRMGVMVGIKAPALPHPLRSFLDSFENLFGAGGGLMCAMFWRIWNDSAAWTCVLSVLGRRPMGLEHCSCVVAHTHEIRIGLSGTLRPLAIIYCQGMTWGAQAQHLPLGCLGYSPNSSGPSCGVVQNRFSHDRRVMCLFWPLLPSFPSWQYPSGNG